MKQEKAFYVEITGCGLESYWYYELYQVGAIVKVKEENGGDYEPVFEKEYKNKTISRQDCRRVYLQEKKADPIEAIDNKVGKWLSAALEDPETCTEMKQDVRAFFDIIGQHRRDKGK